MLIKKYKPVTPSLRHRSILKYPNKSLKLKNISFNSKYHAGRNLNGRITVRHRGGRHKRSYRIIDFKRNISKYSLIYHLNNEYDPNRKTNILRVYNNQFKSFYILNSDQFNNNIKNKYTNLQKIYNHNDHIKLKDIPVGSKLYNIQPLNYVKAPGTYATLMAKHKDFVYIKLPSKLFTKFNNNYTASIGRNNNINHNLTKFGKAGARR
jgi:large subunit ribosomal protein L2